jgi:hypothetical protein
LELLAEFQVERNQEFSIYLIRNIHPNIDRIGTWACQKYGASKMTTNQSESLNCVIKDLNNWKDISDRRHGVKPFPLSQYYNVEILRGRYNYGQHRIILHLAGLCKQTIDKPVLPEIIDPTTIIRKIKDAEKNVDVHFNKCEANANDKQNIAMNEKHDLSSVYERALAVIQDKEGISMPTTTGEFIVKGTLGSSHVVTLFPKISCTCAGYSNCYHVLACEMSIGRRQTTT